MPYIHDIDGQDQKVTVVATQFVNVQTYKASTIQWRVNLCCS